MIFKVRTVQIDVIMQSIIQPSEHANPHCTCFYFECVNFQCHGFAILGLLGVCTE